MPIATQIQKISMCNPNTSLLIAVTPCVMFRSLQAANDGLVKILRNTAAKPLLIVVVAFLNIRIPWLQ